jgi:GNAT superfamily N-acetyltransferase
MRIVNKRLNKFSPEIRRAIRSLSLRAEGRGTSIMREEPDVDVFLALDKNNVLIGWVLCSMTLRENMPVSMLYVRKSMRRQGVGFKLMEVANKKYRKLGICPWDEQSRQFFSKICKKKRGLTVVGGYSL